MCVCACVCERASTAPRRQHISLCRKLAAAAGGVVVSPIWRNFFPKFIFMDIFWAFFLPLQTHACKYECAERTRWASRVEWVLMVACASAFHQYTVQQYNTTRIENCKNASARCCRLECSGMRGDEVNLEWNGGGGHERLAAGSSWWVQGLRAFSWLASTAVFFFPFAFVVSVAILR